MAYLRDIIYYFSVFRKHLGYRLYIVFFLTGLATATEAFGITLLLPLIELMESSDPDTEVSGITGVLQSFLETIGIADSVIGILLFIAGVFMIKGAIKFSTGFYHAVLLSQLLREIKGNLFQKYRNMDYRYYTNQNTGHFVNIISQQVNRLLHGFIAFKKFLSEIIITLMYMIFAFLVSWEFALMAAFAGVIILILFQKLNYYVKQLSVKSSEEYSSLHAFLVQTLQSFPYLAATAQFDHLASKVTGSVHKLANYMRRQQIASAFTGAVREPVSVLILLTIIILQITVFDARIASIVVSLLLIYRSIGHFMAIQSSWQQTMNMAGGIDMVEKEFEQLSNYQESSGGINPGELTGQIRYENVVFSYDNQYDPTLRDISFIINPRETVAFFGPSGAGKSTLIDTLTLLLQPQEGTIAINDIPHPQIDRHAWRKQIGYVSQDMVMFDDTIANNIAMWSGDYNADSRIKNKIKYAAKQADAIRFIEDLPDGFNTKIGDRGVRLSGGQKQRLFIARELFKSPTLLILDEATNSLDSETELTIRNSIVELKGTLTVVIITHHMASIRKADRIYTMNDGQIINHGKFDELIENDSSFRNTAESQQI